MQHINDNNSKVVTTITNAIITNNNKIKNIKAKERHIASHENWRGYTTIFDAITGLFALTAHFNE